LFYRVIAGERESKSEALLKDSRTKSRVRAIKRFSESIRKPVNI
jgi:hypothetical protein